MVTGESQLKILDFGLAKLVLDPVSDQSSGADRSRSETQEGVILGTARYMSPEQARARGSVDHRSDQFAVGSILYEMLTGRPAFARDSAALTIAAIIENEPEPLRRLNRKVPASLDAVVRRCLEKDPARRYESTTALLQALTAAVAEGEVRVPRRRVLVGVAAAVLAVLTALVLGLEWRGDQKPSAERPLAIASLAVVPFEDPSGDPDREYFADGMTEALITSLARMGALRVMSRSASMHYKGTEKTLPEIARELDVEALLTGSTRLEGDRVRLTAQLVHPRTQTPLWEESYEAELGDVLALQADVARAVAREVRVQLAPDEEARLATARAVQPGAYEDYLRGVYYLNQFTPEGFEKGLRHLHAAVESDPADALAWAGLALGYNLLGHGPDPPPDAFTRARAAAHRALALDDTLADVHLALAEVALYGEWDWPAAEDRLARALAANPNLAEAHYHNAWYQLLRGRNDEAIAEMERAKRLDPFTPKYAAWLGSLYWTVGRNDEAIETARSSMEVSPGFPIAWYVIGEAHAAKGEFQEAIAAHQKAAEHRPWRWPLANTLALAGRTEEAQAIAAELARSPTPLDAWGLAEIHATLGERDEAFGWLEACVERRLTCIPWVRWYPNFASLRDDPRFHELERRMNVLRPGDPVARVERSEDR